MEVTINPPENLGPRGWVASGQTNAREGLQPQPSADTWIKALLSKALPTRARLSFSHSQFLASRSLHKLLSFLHQRADRRCKKNHSPTAAKTKTALQKLNQDEKAESYVQIKGQDKIPEKQRNEVETASLPRKEFRIMIVKMIQDLGKTMEKMQEMFVKDLEELKNKQAEMNNTLEGINSRTIEAKEWINDLEDRMVEITATEQHIENRVKRNEDSLRDLWDNIQCTNIRIRGVAEGKEREKGPEKIFEETIAENFPNTGMEIVNQVQKPQGVPRRINPRRNTLRHIVIKLTKIKGKVEYLKQQGKMTSNIQEYSHQVIS